MNPLRLEQMTMFDVAPEEVVQIAADLGIPLVSFFAVEAFPGARLVTRDNKRRVLERLRDTPVKVDSVEAFILGDDPSEFEAAIALAAELGSRTIVALDIAAQDDNQAADQLAALCGLAQTYGQLVGLEPISMGRSRTIGDAARVLQLAGAANARITLDLLHVMRTDTPLSEIAELDASLIGSAQVCDGPAIPPQDLLEEASFSRGVPGSGDFPISEFLALVPPTVPVGLEIPLKSHREAGMSAHQRSRMIVDAIARFA
jgi:sugar phosphate isomerase/epimerase